MTRLVLGVSAGVGGATREEVPLLPAGTRRSLELGRLPAWEGRPVGRALRDREKQPCAAAGASRFWSFQAPLPGVR